MAVTAQVTVDEAMKMGERHYANGNLLLADRIFRDVINSVPDYHPALHYLGVVSYTRGNLQDALPLIQKAVALDPKNPLYTNNYAVMLSESGEKEKALGWWKKSLTANPKYADSYSNMANTLWQLRRFKEAETAARTAVKLNTKFIDGMLNLGNALQGQDKLEDAVKIWEKAVKLDPKFDKGWNNIGNALRDLGRLKEAEKACRKATGINPRNSQAWNNLANVMRDLGFSKEAEDMYRQAIALVPAYAEAHNNLAVAMIDQQRYQEALQSLRYAVAFRPDYAEAYSNLSLTLRELGDLTESEVAAQKAISLQPDMAAGYIDLADTLFLADRYEEAEIALKEARKLAPDLPRIRLKLAAVLERANRFDEALKLINATIKKFPEYPELYHRKAGLFFMTDHLEEAKKQLLKALELKPDYAPAYGTLAEIEQSLGNVEESTKIVRKALTLGGDLPFIYYTLSKTKKFKKNDPDFKAMRAMIEKASNMGRVNAACLHFALYKAYEDIGDYKTAFDHLKQGNDLKRQTVTYDAAKAHEPFERVKEMFSASLIKSFKGKGYKSDRPVFILGMPRSGTTLTEQIISSHPDVFAAGELSMLGATDNNFSEMTLGNAAAMGKSYVDSVLKEYPEAKKFKHFTDKMPGNFIRIGQIACILPHAKIIHCRRDPIDTCLSCYKQLFARGQYWSYDLEELAEQYRLYEGIMEHWRKALPGNFLEVQYEDTVGDLETQARRMIDFIGLPWNDACLTPHRKKRAVLTASKMQVIRPVYKTSVKSWKPYEKQLQPLIKGLSHKEAAVTKKKTAVKVKAKSVKTKMTKTKMKTKTASKPAKKRKA